MARTLPPHLLDRPFTRNEGRAAGLSDEQLQGDAWRQVFRGVWVSAALEDNRDLRLAAARLLIPPYGVLCGLTAAYVRGADVRRLADIDVHVGFPKGRRIRNRDGLLVCQETLDPFDVMVVDGVAVTGRCSAARGPRLGRAAEVIFRGQTPAAQPARRRTLLADGIPRPVAQHEVFDPWGAFVARVDLAFPSTRWRWSTTVPSTGRSVVPTTGAVLRCGSWAGRCLSTAPTTSSGRRSRWSPRYDAPSAPALPDPPHHVECDELRVLGRLKARTSSHSTGG
jgi:hypothetical protein